jgi:hypothetical protein
VNEFFRKCSVPEEEGMMILTTSATAHPVSQQHNPQIIILNMHDVSTKLPLTN